MLVLALPLTLMACTAESPAPASKPDAAKPAPAKVDGKQAPEPAPVGPAGDGPAIVQPIDPADGGVAADPVPPTDDRVMATKYGGPPVMDDPGPKPVDSLDSAKPDEPRPAKKYGAPPRPAPKYGGAPKPGAGDPLEG